MNCKNCGNKLNEIDKYCNCCGSLLELDKSMESQNKNTFENNSDSFDEKLIKSYIGNKADKMYVSIQKGRINIWAILFGGSYFAYRKMYFISIIIIIINSIDLIPFGGTIIGLMFNPIYKWYITRKVKKIKADNPNVDEITLLSIAHKKGGTSILGTMLFLLISMLITFIF